MGICASGGPIGDFDKNDLDRHNKVEAQYAEFWKTHRQVMKLLLLGAGESGKSTLFKQMIHLYGDGYSLEDRWGYSDAINDNVISGMRTLIKYSSTLGETKTHTGEPIDCRIRDHNMDSKRFVEQMEENTKVDGSSARHLRNLWGDAGIKNTYALRSKFQLPDSASYFFERIDQIAHDNYVPEYDDVLHCRQRTTGIHETQFTIEETQFMMIDVGGQRNERSKWIHCFENVTAVLFVAAMSEYDQVLWEDNETNRLVEALNLFEEICGVRWFQNTGIILFLNKADLFKEKIKSIPIGDYFENYNDGREQTYETGCEFMQEMFMEKSSNEREIYTHVTCATNTENVHYVFNAVKDQIARTYLKIGGLLN